MKVYRSEFLRGELEARDLPEDLFNEFSGQDYYSLAVRTIQPEDDVDFEVKCYILVDRYASNHIERIFYAWDDLVSFLRSYFDELHRFDD